MFSRFAGASKRKDSVAKSDTKSDPEWSKNGDRNLAFPEPQTSKNVSFPCVSAQIGSPKGVRNEAEMEPKTHRNSVEMYANLGRNHGFGVVSGILGPLKTL